MVWEGSRRLGEQGAGARGSREQQAAVSQASSGTSGPALRKGARGGIQGELGRACLPSWEGKKSELSEGGAGRSHREGKESDLNPGKH